MKKIFRLIVLSSMLIVSAYSVKGNNTGNLVIQKNSVDTIELSRTYYTGLIVHTPTTEIYDDGVFRKSFTGYRIYDVNNKLVIKVSPSTEQAIKLKIEAGNYLVKLNSSDPNIYRISVEAGEVNEFAIE